MDLGRKALDDPMMGSVVSPAGARRRRAQPAGDLGRSRVPWATRAKAAKLVGCLLFSTGSRDPDVAATHSGATILCARLESQGHDLQPARDAAVAPHLREPLAHLRNWYSIILDPASCSHHTFSMTDTASTLSIHCIC